MSEITYTGTPINQSPTLIMEVKQAIEGANGKAVVLEDGKLKLAGAGENALGIILPENDVIPAGEEVTVQIKDIGIWAAGGAIAIGDELTSDANGCAVKATTGNFITAIALTEALDAGTLVKCQFIKAGYKPATV